MIHKRKRDKFDWNGMGLLLEESRIGKNTNGKKENYSREGPRESTKL